MVDCKRADKQTKTEGRQIFSQVFVLLAMTKLKRLVRCWVIKIFIIMGTSDVIARATECEAAGRDLTESVCVFDKVYTTTKSPQCEGNPNL